MPTIGNGLSSPAKGAAGVLATGVAAAEAGADTDFFSMRSGQGNDSLSITMVPEACHPKQSSKAIIYAASFPHPAAVPSHCRASSINLAAISSNGRMKSTCPVSIEVSGMLKSFDVDRS